MIDLQFANRTCTIVEYTISLPKDLLLLKEYNIPQGWYSQPQASLQYSIQVLPLHADDNIKHLCSVSTAAIIHEIRSPPVPVCL